MTTNKKLSGFHSAFCNKLLFQKILFKNRFCTGLCYGNVGFTCIQNDLLAVHIIILGRGIVGSFGPGDRDHLTLCTEVTGFSAVDHSKVLIIFIIKFLAVCHLYNNILKSELLSGELVNLFIFVKRLIINAFFLIVFQ